MKNLSAILALMILLTVALACSDSDGTTATKNESSNDAAVESVTLMNVNDETVTNFKTSDLKHKAAVKFSETGAGTARGVWTAVSAGKEKNVKILESEVELTTLMNTANFSMMLDNPFPAGDYQLAVYLNGKLVKTHNYKVQ